MVARVVRHVEQHVTQHVGVGFAFRCLISTTAIKVRLSQPACELLQIVVNLTQTLGGNFNGFKL